MILWFCLKTIGNIFLLLGMNSAWFSIVFILDSCVSFLSLWIFSAYKIRGSGYWDGNITRALHLSDWFFFNTIFFCLGESSYSLSLTTYKLIDFFVGLIDL